MSERLTVIVPVRDEFEVLAVTLKRIRAALPGAEILVVDDGSDDGSGELARELGFRVVRHDRCRGYGAALKTGLAATRSQHIAIIDADGTYDPHDLKRLLRAFVPGGVVIGARQREPSLLRRTLKGLFCLQVRMLTGARVPDLNSGLRVFDRRLAERLLPVFPERFSFTTTMTLGALSLGAPVRFVPVRYERRRRGRSKFNHADALRFAMTVSRGCGWIRAGGIQSPPQLPAWTRRVTS